MPIARRAYCGYGSRWDWEGNRCIVYRPYNPCRWGWRISYDTGRCVPWRWDRYYNGYDGYYGVGGAIVTGITIGVATAAILPDFSDPAYGYFAPAISDDTRSYMEETGQRAVADYMANLNYPLDPASSRVVESTTRGATHALYISGTAKLRSGELVNWLVRVTDDGETRVLSVSSDQYGDFVAG